ncbi:hypothetical protein PoB_001831000 [Plakobranchus ocellatus]|uniref:Uncharacterized protein n=1 Tax=Plakobranchus ocellatus TaxID=259542 RepID=A0AAV3Z8G5_9GAST|nr:hypothetical protein PoB_001831000 [Plakobranchus ocellatus]
MHTTYVSLARARAATRKSYDQRVSEQNQLVRNAKEQEGSGDERANQKKIGKCRRNVKQHQRSVVVLGLRRQPDGEVCIAPIGSEFRQTKFPGFIQDCTTIDSNANTNVKSLYINKPFKTSTTSRSSSEESPLDHQSSKEGKMQIFTKPCLTGAHQSKCLEPNVKQSDKTSVSISTCRKPKIDLHKKNRVRHRGYNKSNVKDSPDKEQNNTALPDNPLAKILDDLELTLNAHQLETISKNPELSSRLEVLVNAAQEKRQNIQNILATESSDPTWGEGINSANIRSDATVNHRNPPPHETKISQGHNEKHGLVSPEKSDGKKISPTEKECFSSNTPENKKSRNKSSDTAFVSLTVEQARSLQNLKEALCIVNDSIESDNAVSSRDTDHSHESANRGNGHVQKDFKKLPDTKIPHDIKQRKQSKQVSRKVIIKKHAKSQRTENDDPIGIQFEDAQNSRNDILLEESKDESKAITVTDEMDSITGQMQHVGIDTEEEDRRVSTETDKNKTRHGNDNRQALVVRNECKDIKFLSIAAENEIKTSPDDTSFEVKREGNPGVRRERNPGEAAIKGTIKVTKCPHHSSTPATDSPVEKSAAGDDNCGSSRAGAETCESDKIFEKSADLLSTKVESNARNSLTTQDGKSTNEKAEAQKRDEQRKISAALSRGVTAPVPPVNSAVPSLLSPLSEQPIQQQQQQPHQSHHPSPGQPEQPPYPGVVPASALTYIAEPVPQGQTFNSTVTDNQLAIPVSQQDSGSIVQSSSVPIDHTYSSGLSNTLHYTDGQNGFQSDYVHRPYNDPDSNNILRGLIASDAASNPTPRKRRQGRDHTNWTLAGHLNPFISPRQDMNAMTSNIALSESKRHESPENGLQLIVLDKSDEEDDNDNTVLPPFISPAMGNVGADDINNYSNRSNSGVFPVDRRAVERDMFKQEYNPIPKSAMETGGRKISRNGFIKLTNGQNLSGRNNTVHGGFQAASDEPLLFEAIRSRSANDARSDIPMTTSSDIETDRGEVNPLMDDVQRGHIPPFVYNVTDFDSPVESKSQYSKNLDNRDIHSQHQQKLQPQTQIHQNNLVVSSESHTPNLNLHSPIHDQEEHQAQLPQKPVFTISPMDYNRFTSVPPGISTVREDIGKDDNDQRLKVFDDRTFILHPDLGTMVPGPGYKFLVDRHVFQKRATRANVLSRAERLLLQRRGHMTDRSDSSDDTRKVNDDDEDDDEDELTDMEGLRHRALRHVNRSQRRAYEDSASSDDVLHTIRYRHRNPLSVAARRARLTSFNARLKKQRRGRTFMRKVRYYSVVCVWIYLHGLKLKLTLLRFCRITYSSNETYARIKRQE